MLKKEKEIKYGDTIIRLKEGEKGVLVELETESATILVNGNIVWDKYEEKEYKYIPPIIRKFIIDNNAYDFERKEGEKETLVDLDTEGESVMFIFKDNLSKYIRARIDLVDLEIFISNYIYNHEDINDVKAKELENMFRNKFNQLKNTAKKYKYDLEYSHSCGEECYAWWDIKFLVKNWNEEGFIEVIKKVSAFNKEVNIFMDKYFN